MYKIVKDMEEDKSVELEEEIKDKPIQEEIQEPKRRGRKRKYPILATTNSDKETKNQDEENKKNQEDADTISNILIKEKLLNDMKLGFDRNLPVDEIIGATKEVGFLAYLVTWVGSDEADLLPAEVCKTKYPQPLIEFFEKHISLPEE